MLHRWFKWRRHLHHMAAGPAPWRRGSRGAFCTTWPHDLPARRRRSSGEGGRWGSCLERPGGGDPGVRCWQLCTRHGGKVVTSIDCYETERHFHKCCVLLWHHGSDRKSYIWQYVRIKFYTELSRSLAGQMQHIVKSNLLSGHSPASYSGTSQAPTMQVPAPPTQQLNILRTSRCCTSILDLP